MLDSEQSSAVMPLVTSTVDNCLGQSCESISECPVYRARARAIEADVVVVNHHLLFADTVLKEESLTRLLPDADLIVVDEAHQVPDVARLFFGERISTRQLFELARDIQREQRLLGDDDPELIRIVTTLENAVDGIVEICFSSIEPLELFLNDQRTRDKLEDIDIALGKLIARLQQVEQRSAGLGHCYSRAMRLSDLFALLTETDIHNEEYAHWIEKQGVSSGRRGFTIVLSPVSVATELGQLFGTPDKNWIFVSATMTMAGSFDHMKNSLGLDDVVESRFESVFDFAEQVRAYVPSGIPLPSSDMHTEKLLSHVLPFIRATTGRIFYLFTSHRAMEKTAELLNYEHDIVFLKQGALPKKRLLEKFRELPGCVLLATQSFWEGVDVRGSDLRCLIIDKLPFSSPENEMVRAQIRAIDSLGGNGFMQFSLPEAAISLKQGFGRLIREESDKGLFILGDSRIHTRNYGKILRQSLPPMTWLQSPDEVHEYILQLEKQPRMSHQSK